MMLRIFLLTCAVCLFGSVSLGAPPATINIHGQLIGAGGMPVSGTRAYTVAFYDAESAGNPIGTAITGITEVSAEGLFNVAVTPPAGILTAGEVWYALGVDTDDPADGNAGDDLFPNRIRVYSVPFALQAQEVVGVNAERVGDGSVDDTEFGTLDGATSNLQAQIDSIDTSGIATNTAAIAQNTADIAQNASDIATNAGNIALKANAADVYTQAEIDAQQSAQDTAIAAKANSADVYTQAEIDAQQSAQDTAIAAKANSADVYSQAEIDAQQSAQDTAIATKANSADVYSQAAADVAFVDAAGDSMSGPLAVDTLNEATVDAGVTADGVTLKDSYVGLPQIAAPADTADKLYNFGGNLFFNGVQVDATSLDKDALANSGTLGFDWADDEIADALTIQGGSVNNDSFSAISDLGAESAIGTGAAQVAAGDHDHNLQDLSGAVTDVQVADALTVQGGAVNNDSFSALSDLNAEAAIGSGAGQVAAGNHSHNLQDLGGAVTDAQVPNNITITEADTLASVTGRGASTNTQLTLFGGLLANTIGEVTAANGVSVDGVKLKDSFVELAQVAVPSPTTNRLYNSAGNLFWNGVQLNGGGGGSTDVDTISYTSADLSTAANGDTLLKRKMFHSGTIVSIQGWCSVQDGAAKFDVRKNGVSILAAPPATWSADVLIEPAFINPSFNVGDLLSIEYISGTASIFEPSVTIIVEYN